ncbi:MULTISPECIES: hypothetical protein [Ralstonia]|jgi:hypothetical protein|uniref:Uncharacterized protein n=2 Tax=Ralstonia pickettii TaxID=329 RepID=R0E9M3_RALPI|nr:hypothetical protein [Ralstonia pickettii]ENZ78087.1 hypothetical protein OR214_02363 [Ralstonia pickettii OR214]MCM3581828.1 hypothetical protein [Ralstonia pickettii]
MKEYLSDAVENTRVLVNLIRERGPIRVAEEILAVAARTTESNASDQALLQVDHLARVARTITSDAVRVEIDRLQAESAKLSDRIAAVDTARNGVQIAAGSILAHLSALEVLIEPGYWDEQEGLGKPTYVPQAVDSSKFDLARLRAAAETFRQWDRDTLAYVSKHMVQEVESFHALFSGFVKGGEYDDQFQMVVKTGHLHRLIHLQKSEAELSAAVTKLKKHHGELSKAVTDLGNLESHVEKWWGSFSAAILGRLPDGEVAKMLAPLVRPIGALDPSWLAQVSQHLEERR